MKRVVFSIVTILLTALFIVFYSAPFIREPLYQSIRVFYDTLDSFFEQIWNNSYGKVITLNPQASVPQVYGAIIVGSWGVGLVLVLVIVSSIVYAVTSRRRARFKKNLKNETEKFKKGAVPPEFEEIVPNRGIYANVSYPYVSLEKELNQSVEEGGVRVEVKKYSPSGRIVASIIYGLLVLFFLFLRFITINDIPEICQPFSGICYNQGWINLNKNLTQFFSPLFKGLMSMRIAYLGNSGFFVGQLLDIILIFIILVVFWIIVLLICHFIIMNYRAKKKIKEATKDIGASQSSQKANSILGLSEEARKIDVSYIANVEGFNNNFNQEQLDSKIEYINSIGQGVKEIGVATPLAGFIPPSVTRQPLYDEMIGEDLSGNLNVTLTDISSVEDNLIDDNKSISIESYMVPEEGVNLINPLLYDITNIAFLTDNQNFNKADFSHQDDMIDFDEDGYAYLVKEGKPYFDEEEDISDVITNNNLSPTASIIRFGNEYYDKLNQIEPFELRPLNYKEEIENIKNRIRDKALSNEENLLKESLTQAPFLNVLPILEKEEPIVNQESEENLVEENAPEIKQEIIKEEKKEKYFDPHLLPFDPEDKKSKKIIRPIILPLKIKSSEDEKKKENINKVKILVKPLRFDRRKRKHPSINPINPVSVSLDEFNKVEEIKQKPVTKKKEKPSVIKKKEEFVPTIKPIIIKPLDTSKMVKPKVDKEEIKKISKPITEEKKEEFTPTIKPIIIKPLEVSKPKKEVNASKENKPTPIKPIKPVFISTNNPKPVSKPKGPINPISPKVVSKDSFLGEDKKKKK